MSPENSSFFFFLTFCPFERLLAVRWIIAVHLIATLLSALRRLDKRRMQSETSLLRFYANIPRRNHCENMAVSLSVSPPRPNMTSVINIRTVSSATYHILLTQMQRKFLRYDCGILQKNFVDRLRREKSRFNTWSAASLSNFMILLRKVGSGSAAARYHEHSDLCKAAHEVSQRLWIRTLQLLDDLKTLVELSEHIHHGAGEEGVLRCLLKLWEKKKKKENIEKGHTGMWVGTKKGVKENRIN